MKNKLKQLRNPSVFQPLSVVVLIILVILGYAFYQLRAGRISIDDSLVNVPIVSINAPVAGTLTQMNVYEGEKVKKGDNLATVGGQSLYAATDGLIVMTDNQIGSSVNQQTSLVGMINSQDMRIAGTIDENKGLSDIHVGQVVSFTVDALPGQTFWGYVDEISPTAKQTQVSFTISSERPTQQFVVYAKFNADAYPAIKNGMSAKMTIFTSTK